MAISSESWVDIDATSEFSLANLPFGIISTKDRPEPRIGVAIGNYALDLSAVCSGPHKDEELWRLCWGQSTCVVVAPTLNGLAALGSDRVREIRAALRRFLSGTTRPSWVNQDGPLPAHIFIPLSQVQMHLPMAIGDYTDFYAGMHHAFAVGCMFRGPNNALQPNYKHLPVGYHGRSSSIVVSGTPIHRPRGQILDPSSADPKQPTTAPSKKLDFELEMGCFISRPNDMGKAISVGDAKEYIFGFVLLNDWSARDIQAWEYVPLGPFNGKNFATTISPWVVHPDALEGFRTTGITNDVPLQPYLQETVKENVYDIQLEVDIKTSGSDKSMTIARTSSKHLLWSFPQMIAHHTLGGCPLRTGDLLGSGTISGPSPEESGSLLEMSENGKKALTLGSRQRTFLEDGDTLVLRAFAGPSGARVGFGECSGLVLPPLGQ